MQTSRAECGCRKASENNGTGRPSYSAVNFGPELSNKIRVEEPRARGEVV